MSAAVLGVLVVLWAVVLVPMWLKKHERANELAAVDRFSGAMRVLSRRPRRVVTGRYVMMPPRAAAARQPQVSAPVRTGGSPADRLRPRSETIAAVRPTRAQRARHMRRRRIFASVLLALLVLTSALAVLRGGMFIALQAFFDVLLIAGVAQLRAQVIAERARVRRAPRTSSLAPAVAEPVVPALPIRPVSRPASLADRAVSPPPALAEPTATTQRPVELPVPQPVRPRRVGPYVAAEEARSARPSRMVDLTQPGKWTEQRAESHAQDEFLVVSEPMRFTAELLAEQRAEASEIAESAPTSEIELERLLNRAVGE